MRVTYKNLIGKTILVGLTYEDKNGVEIEKTQFHGTIVRAEINKGIVIKKANNEEFFLPPCLSAVKQAWPSEYRLHSTSEVVINPDLLTTWTVTKPN